MHNQEHLLDLTESYLVSLVADAAGTSAAAVDAAAPFGELGVDSFRVLKIIKVLEADFGTLPKTLLFEFFNIESLAKYFVERHGAVLQAKFADGNGVPVPAPMPARAAAPRPAPIPVPVSAPTQALRLLEQDLPGYPELHAAVQQVLAAHMNEGSVSRGTRNIAPNLFIGSARKGIFNYARSGRTILVYAYTGPDDYFGEIAAEMHRHCRAHDLQLSIFSDRHLGTIDGVAYSATPFGALQRVLNLQQFSLEGGAMRRLRYQVSKFEKSGAARTTEYRCGSDPAVDQAIAHTIDKWRETKTMVNPLIAIVREEILAGTLDARHRLFLTYLNDELQNVILISKMCAALNGYLMDLEFYGKDMPLGGLEFGIANVIQALAAEGCEMFSLGGTYGCRLEESPVADPGVDAILNDLHRQNIFNDESNLQFKNKFRPENRSIYLCRAVGSGNPDSVIDIIMMIADPARAQTPDHEHHNVAAPAPAAAPLPASTRPVPAPVAAIAGAPRLPALADAGYNPINLAAAKVDYDLKTDSWGQLTLPAIARRKRHLQARLQRPADLARALAAIFPFDDFALTDSGRSAENVFCQAMQARGARATVVAGNMLFPTTLFHQIDKGFMPRELAQRATLACDGGEIYRGNLDLAALRQQVAQGASELAYVCIELNDNAAGGYPVSLAHLRAVKELIAPHGIPLVLDATRVIENARFVLEHEPAHAGAGLWAVVRLLLEEADSIVVSLAKDFCIAGGLVASRDGALMARVRAAIDDQACAIDAMERKLAALALDDRAWLEQQSAQRWQAVRRIHATLLRHGVPLVAPAGGHCILIDVKRIAALAGFPHPLASFLSCLYLNTGIRAGAHNAGMQQGCTLNDTVRVAIPLGLTLDEADDIAQRIAGLFSKLSNIPELALEGSPLDAVGNIHARFTLLRWHSPAGTEEAAAQVPAAAVPAPPAQPRDTDIAVVGMAGRYPKSRNMAELWDNLVSGRDCTGQISTERLALRRANRYTKPYRGGFIDDVDRFDARFFGVPAQEAAILDPQERLFLEVAYEAIEDAGYFPDTLAPEGAPRDIGVFVGAVWTMYQMLGAEQKLDGRDLNPTSFLWSIANRVSYWMNLTGPSLTLDTACSASLTALKLACDAIRSGECAGAIVGGVNLDLHQSKFDINTMGGSLSPDGVCRSFGKGANGYAQGEGVGALFLKPLAQAVADGDHIYGVIKSAVVSHGGRTSGYTIPSPRPQAALIRSALARAGVDPCSIGYIEAHGTGTELGDSIEIAGLSEAYAGRDGALPRCAIGSVKTNIGHLEAASGIVGIQKILLQMKHRTLAPSLHAAEPSASIDLESSPFQVQQELAAWPACQLDGVELPRRAGISAMGAGGTNAHVILEEYIAPAAPDCATSLRVFPLSARSPAQLRSAALRLRDFALSSEEREQDIAHTLAFGRKGFEHRLAVLASTRAELAARLDEFLAGRAGNEVFEGHVGKADAVTGLLNPRERQELVGLLVKSGDPRRLARLWSDGIIAEWRGIGLAENGRRVALPTYPFARERHWIGQDEGVEEDGLPEAAHQPSATVERYEFSVPIEHAAPSSLALVLDVADKARIFTGQLLANQLGLPFGQVPHEVQLMDTGLTSMDMAEMTQAIKLSLDPAFSPTAFFECTTVASLVALLERSYPAQFEKMAVLRQTVEEVGELTLPAPLQAIVAGQSHVQDALLPLPLPAAPLDAAPPQPMRCALLTGATGFLGIHLLAELLQCDADMRVLCLVRAADREQGLQRIAAQAGKFRLVLDLARVQVLCGDISAPRLGLSDADWAMCVGDAQQIVHASAHVNHIEGYATFRASSQGMLEIIRLAGSGSPKLIQFISSIAGCARKVGNEFSIFEHEDFLEDGQHVYGGYGQSKWVQETYLKRAAQQGIPYVIYRFGELSGSSATGLGQSDDMLHRLLQMRLAIGCREKIANDVLDMLPVDFAAGLVARTGAAPQLWNRIVHATHTKPYGFAQLYRQAAKRGLETTPVAREQFLARCYEFIEYIYSLNSVNGFVLECVMRDVEGSIKRRKMMDSYFATLFPFAQDHFTEALQVLGLRLPDWNALIECYFAAWEEEENGFMHTVRAFQSWRDSAAGLRVPAADKPGEARIIELFMEGEGT